MVKDLYMKSLKIRKVSTFLRQQHKRAVFFYRGAKHLERKPVSVDREQAAMATKMVNLHHDVEELKKQEENLDRMIESRKLQMGMNSANEEIRRYPF